MDDVRLKLLVQHLAFQEGIVHDLTLDISQALSHLDPDDARRMKRKYRKLWRKLARNGQKYWKMHELFDTAPSKKHKINRKTLVFMELYKEAQEIAKKTSGNPESVHTDPIW